MYFLKPGIVTETLSANLYGVCVSNPILLNIIAGSQLQVADCYHVNASHKVENESSLWFLLLFWIILINTAQRSIV